MRKCIVVSDSFKGTLSSLRICELARGVFERLMPECKLITVPVADGGEGTVECFVHSLGAERVLCEVSGPYGEPVTAELAVMGDTAIIEMASAAGLPLVGDNKDPLRAGTLGVGQLIRHAVELGCRKILLGLGGSATNDGGCGCAHALGAEFFDKNGRSFIPTGGTLCNIQSIRLGRVRELLCGVELTVMCDVENPLYGKKGAAYVFAPQKGADAEQVELLDRGLRHMADVLKRDLNFNSENLPGAGAAGGLGAGAAAFLNAELRSGIDIVLDEFGFDKFAANADVVITGEGRFDSQSANGKVMSGVCKRAAKAGAKVYAVCGCASNDADPAALGIEKLFVSSDGTHSMDELRLSCRRELFAAASVLAEEIIKFD